MHGHHLAQFLECLVDVPDPHPETGGIIVALFTALMYPETGGIIVTLFTALTHPETGVITLVLFTALKSH